MSLGPGFGCERVDELAGAVTLGALTSDEERGVAEHLDSCLRPHDEVRSLLGAGPLLAAALVPVEPSPALRSRLMASVAAADQEQAGAAAEPVPARPRAGQERRRWWLEWLGPGWARGLAAAALAAVVVLGAWNVSLQAQVAESQRVTEALADARAAYPVTGEAGQGMLLDTPDGPRFLATDLAAPPAGSLYELWLIGPDGVPVDVGVLEDGGLAVVPVEDGLSGYVTFAVTVETARVEAPTSTPVLVATLDSGGS